MRKSMKNSFTIHKMTVKEFLKFEMYETGNQTKRAAKLIRSLKSETSKQKPTTKLLYKFGQDIHFMRIIQVKAIT